MYRGKKTTKNVTDITKTLKLINIQNRWIYLKSIDLCQCMPSVASSDLYNQNKCDLSVSECSNCVLLEKQLHSALEEL